MSDGERCKEILYLVIDAANHLNLGRARQARSRLRKANVQLATLMVRVDKQIEPIKLKRRG
jgi:hypothetical protein